MNMSSIFQNRKYVKNPYEIFMQNPPVVHRVSTNTDTPVIVQQPVLFSPMIAASTRNVQMGLVLGPSNNNPGGCGCGAFVFK